MLQTDMLAETVWLKIFEQKVNHAQAFATSMRDQNKISSISDIVTHRLSAYRWQKRVQNTEQLMNNNGPYSITTRNSDDNIAGTSS